MRSKNTGISEQTKKKVQAKYCKCFECHSTFCLSYSHILKKQWYADYNDPDNIVLDCINCHHIWDNGTFAQKSKLNSLDRRMEIIYNLYNKSYSETKTKIRNRYNTLVYGLNECGKQYEFIE